MYEELLTLKQHRNLRMMTIKDLAVASKTGTQTIVKIERGDRVKPSSFKGIGEVLGVKPEEIREFMVIAMQED